jgi:hypothetical protein
MERFELINIWDMDYLDLDDWTRIPIRDDGQSRVPILPVKPQGLLPQRRETFVKDRLEATMSSASKYRTFKKSNLIGGSDGFLNQAFTRLSCATATITKASLRDRDYIIGDDESRDNINGNNSPVDNSNPISSLTITKRFKRRFFPLPDAFKPNTQTNHHFDDFEQNEASCTEPNIMEKPPFIHATQETNSAIPTNNHVNPRSMIRRIIPPSKLQAPSGKT